MKRKEFINALIESFGGMRCFADAFREVLEAEGGYSEKDKAHAWLAIVAMMEDEPSESPIAALVGSLSSGAMRPAYTGGAPIDAAIDRFVAERGEKFGALGRSVMTEFRQWCRDAYQPKKEEAPAQAG